MKTLLLALALSLCGCKSVTSIVKGLKDDHSALVVESTSMGGNQKVRRINPGPGHSVTISPDGTIRMDWVGTNVLVPPPVFIPVQPSPQPQPPPSFSFPKPPVVPGQPSIQ